MKKRLLIVLLTAGAVGLFASCQKGENKGDEKISLENPWVLEVPETQTMSAGFVKIVNGTGENDALISAESNLSEVVELHEMVQEDDTMKMRKIDRIEIPAGETVELKRGGLHLMFIKLKHLPTEGENVKIKLNFEKAGSMEIEAPVKKGGETPMGSHDHH